MSANLGVQVELGIYGDNESYDGVRPPPHRGWIGSKGNVYDVKASTVTADNPSWSYALQVIPNEHCGWRHVGYRWMLRRLADGASQWQETTGTWPPGQPAVNFTYEDGWQQWQYKVVAVF